MSQNKIKPYEDLQKALAEVEAIIWAVCEPNSLGREKMEDLKRLFSCFCARETAKKELSLAKERSLRKALDDLLVYMAKVPKQKMPLNRTAWLQDWTEVQDKIYGIIHTELVSLHEGSEDKGFVVHSRKQLSYDDFKCPNCDTLNHRRITWNILKGETELKLVFFCEDCGHSEPVHLVKELLESSSVTDKDAKIIRAKKEGGG